MDGRRFDSFVASLGHATTRRQWLKTCAAGLVAVTYGSLGGRPRAIQETAAALQPVVAPLPNFPFLAVMPTDSRFSKYAVDKRLTGPPTRYRSLDAMEALTTSWRTALGNGFQSAYSATVASPKDGASDEPERGVTTVIFDLGSEEAAKLAHAQYVAALFSDPTINELNSNASDNKQIVLGGCEGGCENLSSPSPSNPGAINELAVVGQRGQFVFDARVRNFANESIDVSDGETVAKLIDGRLSSVTALTTSASAARVRPNGLAIRQLFNSLRPSQIDWQLRAPVRPGKTEPIRYAATDDLRDALASRNTLPIFDLGNGDPPLTATQTLVVDDGAVVINFGESPASAAARQRSAEDVVFACATQQPLPIASGYHGDYDLFLSTIQYVFGNEEDALEFLDETRERLQRDRPRLVLTEVTTSTDELSDVFQDGTASRGFSYGCQSHQILRLGAIAAILAVEITAKPRSAELPPIDTDDLENELCPIVDQSAEKFVLCIEAPDECRSAFPLSMPDAMQPTPTPGPTCPATMTMCSGQCVDTTNDSANCGACGVVCGSGSTCDRGQCQCAPGLVDCGGFCLDLSTDPANCGDCGLACGSNEYCSAGECLCTNGESRCGGTTCCPELWTCESGTCIEPCNGTQLECDGICVDVMSDASNCGACGNGCATETCCGGYCVDSYSDPNNCGNCGESCGEGSCCSGICFDTSSDPNNCGSCGYSCEGLGCCGGQCTNTDYDSNNCGYCGNVCQVGDVCQAGECVIDGG